MKKKVGINDIRIAISVKIDLHGKTTLRCFLLNKNL